MTDHPLLILLHAYILDALDQLPSDHAALIGQSVARTWGDSPSLWKATLRRTFDFPDNQDQLIRELYQRRQAEADLMQESLTSDQFAYDLAMEYLPNLPT